MNDRTETVKIVLVGNPGSGKSSFVMRAANNEYTDQYSETIGVDFAATNIKLNNEQIRFLMWDTAGDKRFASLIGGHLNGVKFAIICCDKTDSAVLTTLKYHLNFIRDSNASVPIFILLTKADLTDNPEPSVLACDFVAATENCHYLGEISAKNNSQEEVQSLLKKAMLTINVNVKTDVDTTNPKDTFFKKYAELRKEQSKPSLFGLLTRTHITKDSSWDDLIENARHKESAFTNQAFLQLNWLDENGNVTGEAPPEMRTAAEQMNTASREMKK